MREAYQGRLGRLADQLADMCSMAGNAMELATKALLDADLVLAEQVISADAVIDDARARCEEDAYSLLALQAPVATDLRTVLSVIHAAESVERMGDLALHVAKTARRRHPNAVLPEETRGYFTDMGRIAVDLARKAEQVIRTSDVELARRLDIEDDAMDDLHRDLFAVVMDNNWPYGVPSAVDITLLGRFYERFGDHAVSVAKRTVFVVTGKMPGYQRLDDL